MDNVFLGAIVGPTMLILGLSLALYPKIWVKIMKELGQSHTGLFYGMIIALVIGLSLIQVHNIWEWSVNVIITVIGWGAFLKGLFYFLAPGTWIKSSIKTFAKPRAILVVGLVYAGLGAWMSYLVYLA